MQRRRCVIQTGIFLLFFALGFIVVCYMNTIFFLYEGQLIFSADQEKDHVEFFDTEILSFEG